MHSEHGFKIASNRLVDLPSGQINRQDVEDALAAILTSGRFSGGGKARDFLRYIVMEEISGRGSKLKAYSIGIDALGKLPSFDPQSDSSVRVLAGRLRQGLEDYYETEGADDPVKITLPLGSYRPKFCTNVKDAASRAATTAADRTMWQTASVGLSSAVAGAFAVIAFIGMPDEKALENNPVIGSLIQTPEPKVMDRASLKDVRQWADQRIASGEEPPWAFYQYMKLREALDVLLDENASLTLPGFEASAGYAAPTKVPTQQSAPSEGNFLRLVDETYSRDSAPRRPE